MAEESRTGLSEQIKELVTESEKHMKAIQDQIANQWEAQQKAIGDLVEAVEGSAEGDRGATRTRTGAERPESGPVGGSAQGDRRSDRAAVERPTESDHGPGGTAVERATEGYRGHAECNRRDVPT